MNKKSYISVFAWSEFKNIRGKNNSRVAIIFVIFLLVLLTIAASKISVNLLAAKMDNPFIKFLNVTKAYDLNLGLKDFQKSELLTYGCDEVLAVSNAYMKFYNSDNQLVDAYARVIDENDAFAKFLEPFSEIIITENIFSNSNWGCIVTEDFLEKLGVSKDEGYIKYVPISHKDAPVLLPIAAIATELPDYTDIIVNDKFYCLHRNHGLINVRTDEHKTYLKFFLKGQHELSDDYKSLGFQIKEKETIASGLIIERLGADNLPDIESKILAAFPSAKRLYNLNRISSPRERDCFRAIETFSFSLSELDKVEMFQEFLFEKYQLKVDMSVIEDKQNFDFLSGLISLLSYVLFAFAAFIVMLFTSNTILNHLNENQKNIGTLKAFGLSNSTIILTYGLIAFALIAFSFLLAYFSSIVLGQLITEYMVSKNFDFITRDFRYENYPISVFIILFVVIPSVVVFLRLFFNLQSKTPGDLIYQR